MRATNIIWDTDGDGEIALSLPNEIKLPQNLDKDCVADYLSDQTGWLVESYDIEPDEHLNMRTLDLPFLPDGVTWRRADLSSPADLADACFVLYGEAPMRRISAMADAGYPCTAIFSHGKTGLGSPECWGRCEGTLDRIAAAIETARA